MKWTKVSDEKPPIGKIVIGFSPFTDDCDMVVIGDYSAHWLYAQTSQLYPHEITHWMPKPEPPTDYKPEKDILK